MTIESIKRSLSATELTSMDKEAVKHTNIVAFVIKTFFENGCSIQAVRDALQERKEDRLEKLFYISLRLISQYVKDMPMPATGIPVYANVGEHTLLNIVRNHHGQDAAEIAEKRERANAERAAMNRANSNCTMV